MAKDLNTVILWEQAVEMFKQEYLPAIRQVEQRNNGGKAYVDGAMRREYLTGSMRTGISLIAARKSPVGKVGLRID